MIFELLVFETKGKKKFLNLNQIKFFKQIHRLTNVFFFFFFKKKIITYCEDILKTSFV